jgi:hypothetical protein
MSADLTKRIMVRVTDEQLAWIGEMAADEGMDNATFVRVVLDRLSKGRAPLIGMMQPQSRPSQNAIMPTVTEYVGRELTPEEYEGRSLQQPGQFEVIEGRAPTFDELNPETRPDQDPRPLPAAATPLRRVERTKYNPGRQ